MTSNRFTDINEITDEIARLLKLGHVNATMAQLIADLALQSYQLGYVNGLDEMTKQAIKIIKKPNTEINPNKLLPKCKQQEKF